MGIRTCITRKLIERHTQVVCSSSLVREPLVSVRILSYNNAEHLQQCIQSALDQVTDFDFEVVIGDDCSTDDTRYILNQFRISHPKQIKILHASKKLKGIANFIRTIDACNGEYIAMLDGDDYWTDTNKLADQVKYMRENYGCACCFTQANVEFHGKEDRSLPKQYAPTRLDYSASQVLSLSFHAATSSMMFRNEIKWPKWIYNCQSDYRAIRGILAERGWFHCIQRKTCTYRSNDWGVLHGLRKDRYGLLILTQKVYARLVKYHSKHRDDCKSERDNLGSYLCRRFWKHRQIKFIKYIPAWLRHKLSA